MFPSKPYTLAGFEPVWPKNTIFAVYSEKFRKFPISLKNRIRTPYPMGILRRTLRKCLLKIFRENRISGRKTRFSRKSDRIFAKFPRLNRENRIPRKTVFTIFADFPQLYDFRDITHAKIGFREKLFSRFSRIFRNSTIFAI
jgi:hypothetical protein